MNKENCISSISECDTAHDGMKYLRLISGIWFWFNVICCMLWAIVPGIAWEWELAYVFAALAVGVLWIALTSIVYLCCNALIDWLGAVLSGFTALNYGVNRTVSTLNKLGGENGIGLADLVENRLVGMKSRGVYETPGGAILYHAHEVLETICLDKETARVKQYLSIKFADIVYNGQWFTPLREAMTAFVNETQKTVTRDVKLKLYKGNIINAGVTSPYTLYDEEVATFDADEVYNQADAQGFINLFGLPIHVKAKLDQKRNNK